MKHVKQTELDPLLAEEILTAIRATLATLDPHSPYSPLLAGTLAAEEFRGQFPLIAVGEHVAHLFKIPGVAESPEVLAAATTCVSILAGAGIPFSMAEEAPGEQHIPYMLVEPREDAPQNSNGSAAEFRFHIDNGVMPAPLRPAHISLSCLDNDAHAETGIVSLEDIVDNLPSRSLKRAVFEYRFATASPPSFGEAGFAETGPRPLIVHTPGGIRGTFNTYRTRPFDPSDRVAAQALAEMERLANELADWVDLRPHEILLFDNERSMHARRAIAGRRRLLRCYWRRGVGDLRRLAGTAKALSFSAAKALSLRGGNL